MNLLALSKVMKKYDKITLRGASKSYLRAVDNSYIGSSDETNHAITNVPERDLNFPSPAVEIVPSKTAHPYKYAGENVELQGLNIFKGRVSASDIIGFSSSKTIHAKPI
ncbi:hypothetical protein MKX01_021869, partial [Papaver californicum]